ncbi:hypothetical protein ACTXT7_007394 [Hymenolepis weldensis]
MTNKLLLIDSGSGYQHAVLRQTRYLKFQLSFRFMDRSMEAVDAVFPRDTQLWVGYQCQIKP